jgi:hypothetical protein
MKPLFLAGCAPLVACVAVAGCAPETGLRITIDDGGAGLENRLEKLELVLVASQNVPTVQPDGSYFAYTCRPSREVFVGDDASFPLVVTVRRGERFFWECVALRVLGYSNADDADPAIRAEALYCEDIEDGIERVTLQLEERCFGVPCDVGQLCHAADGGAACGPSDVHRMFEAPPAVDDACE